VSSVQRTHPHRPGRRPGGRRRATLDARPLSTTHLLPTPPRAGYPGASAYSAYPGYAPQYGAPPGRAPAPGAYGAPPPAGFAVGKPDPAAFANVDLEAQQAANAAATFAEAGVRNRFIGKVLTVVFLQLLVTVGMALTFYYVAPLRLYVKQNAWPFYLSIGLSFGLLIGMACSEKLRRVYPYNVAFLCAFTLVFGFQVATITSYFDTSTVMLAFMATCFVVAGCAFIAFCTKLDMTKYGAYLAIAGLAFIATSLIAAFWPWRGGGRNWTIIGISFVGTLLFSAYLIYDLQLLVGGKTVSVGPDDWVFASISIYLDVINIFLQLLQIIAMFQNNN
jgi:FtsH-binding integral membrane protein